jgi:UDP-GlcNAc3NAcA epimerase
MPEEINRIVCDHTATMLFTPTRTGINNLIREGFNPHTVAPFSADNPGLFHCGDIMLDNTLFFSDIADIKSNILNQYQLEKGNFVLGTIHRDNNTDNPERLTVIFEAIQEIATEHGITFVLPLHPRTSKIMKQNLPAETFSAITSNPLIKIIPPASFFDMLTLEKHCRMVMTDSGGVQKEAYFFQKPVIILRPETEWVEIVEAGAGVITDAYKPRIIKAFQTFTETKTSLFPPVFGDGKAAEFICKKILET